MLTFHSGQAQTPDIQLGIAQCMRTAFPDNGYADCGLVILHSTRPDQLLALAEGIRRYIPDALIVGNSSAGVIGRENPSNPPLEFAIMAICGPEEEYAVRIVSGIYQDNSYEKAHDLAWSLREVVPEATCAYLLCQGADLSHNRITEAFSNAFGDEFTLIGGTISDPACCFAYLGNNNVMIGEQAGWVVGFADPTIRCTTRWLHNSVPYGEPLTVSKSRGNRIFEFNGRSAFNEFTSRLDIDVICDMRDPVTVLAEELPFGFAEGGGSEHLLHSIVEIGDSSISLPIDCPVGLHLWPTKRDFKSIYSIIEDALDVIGLREPLAVFQVDTQVQVCGFAGVAVGTAIAEALQEMFALDNLNPPWLGMRCFGGYAKVGDANSFHNHTVCIAVLHRRIGDRATSCMRLADVAINEF